MENDAVTFNPGSWNFDFGNGLTGSLLQGLLPSMTQDESAKETFYDGFHTASAHDFFLFGGKLYELREAGGKVGEVVQSARQFIQESVRSKELNTQTIIQYQHGEDAIIQNYGTVRDMSNRVNFVGKNGEVNKNLSLEQSLALTGKKPEEVVNIINYLNGTSGYVWRLGRKPDRVDERVVRLNAVSVRFDLICVRYPPDAGVSLGVLFSQKS